MDSTAPATKSGKAALTIEYSDRHAGVLTWWKAFFFIPIWGVLALPLIGMVSGIFGNTGMEAAFVAIMLASGAYFVDDLLKKKLRIEDQILSLGFRHYPLHDVVSVGVKYNRKGVLPTHLLLYFRNGRILKIKISRLRNTGFNTLLKQIERANPQCVFDPVIATLEKCKRVAHLGTSNECDFTAITYHAHRHIVDLYHTFTDTAGEWVRLGPALVCFLFSPMWLYFCLYLFSVTRNAFVRDGQTAVYETIKNYATALSNTLTDSSKAIGETIWHVSGHPILLAAMLATAGCLIWHLVRAAIRPNLIMIEDQDLTLNIQLLSLRLPLSIVDWPKLIRVALQGSKGDIGSDSCRISLEYADGVTPMCLDLYAIDEHDRTRLLKAIQKRAPQCVIEPEVSEALMPRQSKSHTELWLQSMTGAPDRKNLEPLGPGQMLGNERYEVVRRLGIGGIGTAYLCADLTGADAALAPQVVLKETLLPVFVEPQIRQQTIERFEHEALMLQKVDHPSIVKLVDFFIEDHRAYLVLEHIEGQTLRQLVTQHGPLASDQVIDLGLQMCEILTHLHERDIIHRDFTPDNMILDTRGRLRLLDFNVAQQAQSGTTGTIVGKHSYLPPEQFRGKPVPTSDVYAMGATMYFILTGQDPEPITQSRPSSQIAEVNPGLDDFCASATTLSVNNRFASATAAHEELVRLATGAPPQSAQSTHAPKVGGTIKLNTAGEESRTDPGTDVPSDAGHKIDLTVTERVKQLQEADS